MICFYLRVHLKKVNTSDKGLVWKVHDLRVDAEILNDCQYGFAGGLHGIFVVTVFWVSRQKQSLLFFGSFGHFHVECFMRA